MYNSREIGAQKEDLAAEYLREKGYFIIEKNYRVRQGEIDLVARDGDCIVFVEVKYRRDEACGNPLEAVTSKKQRQICKTAYYYMNQKKISTDNTAIRFDVVGITGKKIEHIMNAFDFIV